MSKHDFYSSLALIQMISKSLSSGIRKVCDYIEVQEAFDIVPQSKIKVMRTSVDSLLSEVAKIKQMSKNFAFLNHHEVKASFQQSMPACFFHPITIVFLDDNQDFLDLLRSNLDIEDNIVTFVDSAKAIEAVNSAPSKASENVFSYQNDVEADIPGTQLIDLNIGKIRNAIYDRSRFYRAGVFVVDYKLPGTNGVDICRAILNQNICKVMLTAEASLDTVISAFNSDIIDKYIEKTNDNLFESLSNAIHDLKLKYFHNLSEAILKNTGASLRETLNLNVFIELFYSVFYESNAVEYYLVDTSGSYLFMDESASQTWLIVRNDQDFNDQLEMLAGFDVDLRVIDALTRRDKLLFLLDSSDYEQPTKDWESCLFDAHQLSDNLWYAIVKGPIKSSVEMVNIKPYQGSK